MATNTPATTARQVHTQQTGYLRKRITFANTNTTVDVGQIPAGASVIGGGVHIVTADAAITLDVGFRAGNSTDDPNAYATALTVAGIGFIPLDELGATTNIQQTEDAIVTASLLTGSDTFVGDVIVLFIPNNDH